MTSPRLVVVDVLTMFRARRGDKKSSYEADYEAIQELQRIASDTPGLAIVIVHHLRKRVGPETDPFEKVSGTMGLAGGADTVLVLNSNGNWKTLYGRGAISRK